ncbi:adenosine deaminase [Sphingobium sp. AP49]|uniref:adenosine deaminase n=1 Tax=Sphingobium sp. AP49 TaxID=1144307 RepID=UPI00026ECF00|nr:adenosine deaminase [Sphingobium sp. AP49]WHO37753.1 adenosine deaminase [Sphingobium sp. AP49]
MVRGWLAAVVLSLLVIAPRPTLAADETGESADRAFIMGLPKAELHVHLEGTMEPELYLEMARRNGIATRYATPEDVRSRLRDANDLSSFIQIYEELVGVMQTERDFHDVALAYFRKARSQGVVHAEVYVDPQLHQARGVSLATLYGGLARAREDASRELGLDARFILSFLRDRPADQAAQVLEESRPWLGSLIIGVGLDNPEVDDFPAKFQAVYARARELGLHLTSHCDVDQPNTVAHHWSVIKLLGVERIDHGLNVLNDPALVEEVRRRKIGLTGAATLFYADIPGRMEYRAGAIARLLDKGLLVTVNSDDPGMKRSLYVGDLMLRVQQTTGMDRAHLAQLARNSFAISWIEPAQRRAYALRLKRYLRQSDLDLAKRPAGVR